MASEEISESRINEILEETGKGDPSLQLNLRRLRLRAAGKTPLPWQRAWRNRTCVMPLHAAAGSTANRHNNRTNPNGVELRLDDHLHILHMNPAFQKLFSCNNSMLGRHISSILDVYSFEQLASGKAETRDSIRVKEGIKYHEIAYALTEEKQIWESI